jgi:mannose-6-phosphate isomerase-like protein (cupin superfamily)
MKAALVITVILFCIYVNAQTVINVDSVGSLSKTENIYNRSVFGDSLASSFCIVIKKEVKPHKHITHSEHVIVMEGEGIMKSGDKTFPVKKGDLVFIPKNTVHSVKTTGKIPLKVISVQSPVFDGKDRIMIEEK